MTNRLLERIKNGKEISQDEAFNILPASEVKYLLETRAEFSAVSHYYEYDGQTLHSSEDGRYYIID